MRIAIVLLVLPLGACAGAYHTSSDGRLQARINDAYKARDASLARTAAMACTAETDKLIEVSNLDGDPKVAARIRQDSEFRARGIVLRARGQTSS